MSTFIITSLGQAVEPVAVRLNLSRPLVELYIEIFIRRLFWLIFSLL
jgi:hypothetical protein